jgi:hypothetical protein
LGSNRIASRSCRVVAPSSLLTAFDPRRPPPGLLVDALVVLRQVPAEGLVREGVATKGAASARSRRRCGGQRRRRRGSSGRVSSPTPTTSAARLAPSTPRSSTSVSHALCRLHHLVPPPLATAPAAANPALVAAPPPQICSPWPEPPHRWLLQL